MNATAVEAPKAVWIRLKPDQFARLQALAEADDRPAGAMARRLLTEAMARLDTPKKEEALTVG